MHTVLCISISNIFHLCNFLTNTPFLPHFQTCCGHRILPGFYHSFTKRAFFFPGKSPQFSTKYFVDNVDIFVYKSIFPRFSVFFLWITLRSYPLLFCPVSAILCTSSKFHFVSWQDKLSDYSFCSAESTVSCDTKNCRKEKSLSFLQSQFSQKFFDDRKRIRRFFWQPECSCNKHWKSWYHPGHWRHVQSDRFRCRCQHVRCSTRYLPAASGSGSHRIPHCAERWRNGAGSRRTACIHS